MSREDLDQEGSLDLDQDQYQDQDQQYPYQGQGLESPGDLDGGPQANRALEYKVQDGGPGEDVSPGASMVWIALNTFSLSEHISCVRNRSHHGYSALYRVLAIL